MVVQEVGAVSNVNLRSNSFWGELLGSEVCDGSAQGICYRNSGTSSRWSSYWCIVVVREIVA